MFSWLNIFSEEKENEKFLDLIFNYLNLQEVQNKKFKKREINKVIHRDVLRVLLSLGKQ